MEFYRKLAQFFFFKWNTTVFKKNILKNKIVYLKTTFENCMILNKIDTNFKKLRGKNKKEKKTKQ